MAGIGSNDAPGLEQNNVGCPMGAGTDIVMQSAEITLVKRRPERHCPCAGFKPKGYADIKQNLFFAFVYNALGIPVAAGILSPFFVISLSPIIAAAL